MYPINQIRSDFPILQTKINGKPLVYFDNAATTQKPKQVIETVSEFYKNFNGNIHRANHFLSLKSTELYDQARKTVQRFINAEHDYEIIFTRGTTEAINLVANSLSEVWFEEGDEIIITEMEHHSNIVPWQIIAERKNLKIKVLPLTDDYQLDLSEFANLFTDKTKLVAITFMSNTLGTINNIFDFIHIAHSYDVPVLVDAAQAISHIPVDVQFMDADFLVFSGHKIFAHTGIGVLYGKEKFLDMMPPYQGGGDMIESVSFEKTTFAKLPFKFEAGTANYAGALSLKTALEYIENIGIQEIAAYEGSVHEYALKKLAQVPDIQIYSTSRDNKASIVSFNIKGLHFEDIGILLDKFGIAVRTGAHCTHPLMKRLGIQGTVRMSLSIYNTMEEVDYFCDSLLKVIEMLK